MSCYWTGNHPENALYRAQTSDWMECSKVWSLLAQRTTDRLEHQYITMTCVGCGRSVKKSKYRKMNLG
jgi:hypothetical protein